MADPTASIQSTGADLAGPPASARPAPTGRRLDYALLLLLAVLWSASYSFIRVGVETIPPITFIAVRTLIAGLILLLVLRLRGRHMPRDAASWRMFAFQAVMNSVIPFTLIAWAEQSVEAGLATILNSTTPIFTFLFAWCVLGIDGPSVRKVVGMIAGFTGVILVVGIDALVSAKGNLLAELAILSATATYAVSALYSRNFANLDPMVPAAGSMLCGAAVLLPTSLVVDHPWTLSPSMSSVLALLALAVFSTALAFVIYFHLVRALGPVAATSQAFLRTPIGVMIGAVFLGERLASTAWIGLVCVVIGVAAMTIAPRSR